MQAIMVLIIQFRSTPAGVFLRKRVPKFCTLIETRFINNSRSKQNSNFIEIALRHGCSPVYLLHIFRTPFLKNTSERLLLPVLTLV